MNDPFTVRLVGTLNSFLEAVLRFLPGLMAALLIVVLGTVIAWLVRVILRRVLLLGRFDRLADAVGASHVLARADVRAKPSELAATVAFWCVFVSFAMAGLSAMEIRVIDRLIGEFFLYLPRIFAALGILLAGYVIGNFLARASLLTAVNAELPSPRGISLVVKFLIAILSFAMALEQLEIARSIVLAAFIILFGAVMLGLALAFGVGGRDIARRVLERQFRAKAEGQETEGFSHL